MATAQKAQSNIQLLVSDEASPEVFTELDGLQTISGPDGSASEIDVTDLNSTAREFLMGLADSGSIQISGFYDGDDTQQGALRSDWLNVAKRSYILRLALESPNEDWAFDAYVSNFTRDGSVDQAIQFSATLRITGAITVTG